MMKMWVHWSRHRLYPEAAFLQHCQVLAFCVALWLPCLLPFPKWSPICFLVVHAWELSFTAFLCNVLTSGLKLWSRMSLPETLCTYPVTSTVISGKFPVHKGLFASLLYAQGRTNPSVSLTTTPGWSHKTQDRILIARRAPVPVQLSLSVGLGSLAPRPCSCLSDIPSGIIPVSPGVFL